MARMFGTDGVRGVANKDLSCELALKIGKAGAYVLTNEVHQPRILLGRDTRLSGDMLSAVDRALALYETDQPKWKQLMKKGMQVDLSWDKSASAYEEIYRKLCHCDGES